MIILFEDNNCIITPLSPCLNRLQTERLTDAINSYNQYRIGLNMNRVVDCSFEFIDTISKIKNLNIYNITSDIFVLFNKMGLDKCINLYNYEEDFIADKHRLLNRNFSIV